MKRILVLSALVSSTWAVVPWLHSKPPLNSLNSLEFGLALGLLAAWALLMASLARLPHLPKLLTRHWFRLLALFTLLSGSWVVFANLTGQSCLAGLTGSASAAGCRICNDYRCGWKTRNKIRYWACGCYGWTNICDDDDGGGAGSVYLPPDVSGELSCTTWGDSNWCIGDEVLEIIASDPQDFPLTISGNTAGIPFSCSNPCSLALPEGSGTVIYQVTAGTSGLTDSGAINWMRDITPPFLSLVAPPVDGLHGWYGSPVSVQTSASDALSGIFLVEGTVGEGAAWQPLPITLGEGVWPLAVRAFDSAGNQALVSAVFFVDTTPPESLFTSHTDGDRVSGLVALEGQTSDDVSGPVAGEISVDGGVTWQPLVLNGNPAAWSLEWNAYSLPDGEYSLLMRAVDEAGHRGNAARVTLEVDNPAPSVSLTDSWPVQSSGRLQVTASGIPVRSVAITITDPDTGWIVTEFDLDPGTTDERVSWDGRLKNGNFAPAGTYPVRVRVCDIFDNCRKAEGTIVVSYDSAYFVVPAQTGAPSPTLTATMPPLRIASPAVTSTAIMTAAPVQAHVTPEPTPAPVLDGRDKPQTWPVTITGGFVLMFAVLLSLDPRPAALHALARAIKPTLKE